MLGIHSYPLLGIHLEKNMIQKDTSTPKFIATLFTIAKMWKKPKRQSPEKWIKKIHTHTHTMEYYSVIKTEWDHAICSNRDGPRDSHTEGSQSDREGEILHGILYVESKKESCKWTYLWKRLTDLENELVVAGWGGEEWEEGIIRESGVDIQYTWLCLKWITNKDLPNSTWNSA